MFDKSKYLKEYYQKNKEHQKERRRISRLKFKERHKNRLRKAQKKYRNKLKMEVLAYYSINGIPACVCCSEQRLIFLNIDHINGGGYKQRMKLKTHGGQNFYNWIKKNKFPPGFRVLCFNCNFAIHHLGRCPHTFSTTEPI